MIRVAIDFADVKGGRRHHIAQVRGAEFNHQVRVGHRPPELRFDHVALEARRHLLESVRHEEMRADVRAVPITVMRTKHHPGLVLLDDVADHFHAPGPITRVLFPRLRADPFQAVRAGGDQAEAHILAGGLEFLQTGGLALALAAKRDRHVDEIHSGLPHQPHRDAAHDAFVVRVRREEECFGSTRGKLRAGRRGESAQRKRPSLL